MLNLNLFSDMVNVQSVSTDLTTCALLLDQISQLVPNPQLDDPQQILWWGHPDLTTTEWLINTHVDIVPGNPAQFKLTTTGDKAWGRGVADVKGCATILVDQAQKWDQLAQQKRITFMLVTDEEVGGESTKQILPTMHNLQGAIFLEPTNLHITNQAKGMMQVKIIASGMSCHGSRPWEGTNAIEKLVSGLVQFLLQHPTPHKETRNTTFNFSQIKGGAAINQVPASAELWCDIRFNPLDSPEKIATLVRSSFPSCQVSIVKSETPINCAKDTQLLQSLALSLKANSVNPLTHFDHGTSDARHATALGIPAIVFGPKGGGFHSNHEWVSLKSLDKVTSVLDHWIKNI